MLSTLLPASRSPSAISSARQESGTAAPPFITSTLQQEASRKLNMTPRRTMSIAAELYEGIESVTCLTGLITYMRTDSRSVWRTRATLPLRAHSRGRYGEEYYLASCVCSRPGNAGRARSHSSVLEPCSCCLKKSGYLTPDRLAVPPDLSRL